MSSNVCLFSRAKSLLVLMSRAHERKEGEKRRNDKSQELTMKPMAIRPAEYDII